MRTTALVPYGLPPVLPNGQGSGWNSRDGDYLKKAIFEKIHSKYGLDETELKPLRKMSWSVLQIHLFGARIKILLLE